MVSGNNQRLQSDLTDLYRRSSILSRLVTRQVKSRGMSNTGLKIRSIDNEIIILRYTTICMKNDPTKCSWWVCKSYRYAEPKKIIIELCTIIPRKVYLHMTEAVLFRTGP